MSRAEKLLERMRRSLSGWGQADFATLYKGFGFAANQGANHIIYIHKKYPELRAAVGRHNELAKGYAEFAIKVIDKLKALEAMEEQNND